MTISRVGQNAVWNGTTAIASTTSLGMTAVAGDLIVVYAFRNGSTTPPTVGSGYTSVSNPTGANTCAGILAYKVAAGGETTAPVFTNCTAIAIAVYRSSSVAAMLVRSASQSGANNSTTITFPAATTFGHSDGSSARFIATGHKGATNMASATMPTGFTRATNAGTAGAIMVGEQLLQTSGASTSMTVTTTGAYRAAQAEIVEAQSFSSAQAEAATLGESSNGLLPVTLPLDFTTGTLPVGVVSSGGVNGSRVNSSGNMVFGQSAPRFDYTPAGVSRGLLNEPLRQNFATAPLSPGLGPPDWNNGGRCTVTQNATTSPSGATDAAKFQANAGTVDWACDKFNGDNIGTSPVVISHILKYGNHRYIWLRSDYNSSPVWICADFVSNIIAGVLDGNSRLIASAMVDLGGGWFDIRMLVTPDSSGPGYNTVFNFGNAATPTGGNVTLAGTEYVYVFAANLQIGSTASTYIGSVATRSADAHSFIIPSGVTSLLFTFDDATTQTVTGLTPGAYYTMPALNGTRITGAANPSGGTTYNDTASESATAAESRDAALTATAARAESSTLVEASAGGLAMIGDRTEAATLSDAAAGGLSLSAADAELASAAESTAVAVAIGGGASEAAVATDSSAAAMSMPAARSEATSAAEAIATELSMSMAASESAIGAEASVGGLALLSAQAEAALAGESSAGAAPSGVFTNEAASLDDAQAGALSMNAVQAEAGPVLDASAASLAISAARDESSPLGDGATGGLAFSADRSEGAALGDAQSFVIALGAIVAEAVALVDQSVTTALLGATQTEAGLALDLSLGGLAINAARADAAPAADSMIGGALVGANHEEGASAVDWAVYDLLLAAGLVEAGAAIDVSVPAFQGSVGATESASAGEVVTSVLVRLVLPRNPKPIKISGSSRRPTLVGEPIANLVLTGSSRRASLIGKVAYPALTGSSRRPLIGIVMHIDIAAYIGETWTIDGVAQNANGTPIDLTSGSVEFRICSKDALVLKLVSPADIAIVDGPKGLYTITLADTDARQNTLLPATYDYEVDVIAPAGVSVQNSGQITLKKSLRKKFPGA